MMKARYAACLQSALTKYKNRHLMLKPYRFGAAEIFIALYPDNVVGHNAHAIVCRLIFADFLQVVCQGRLAIGIFPGTEYRHFDSSMMLDGAVFHDIETYKLTPSTISSGWYLSPHFIVSARYMALILKPTAEIFHGLADVLSPMLDSAVKWR